MDFTDFINYYFPQGRSMPPRGVGLSTPALLVMLNQLEAGKKVCFVTGCKDSAKILKTDFKKLTGKKIKMKKHKKSKNIVAFTISLKTDKKTKNNDSKILDNLAKIRRLSINGI